MASGGGIQQMPDELTGSVFTALMWQLLEDNINNGIVTQLGARVWRSTTLSVANAVGSPAAIPFDQDVTDTDGMHSTTSLTTQITANYDGWHTIKAAAQFAFNATGVRRLQIRLNGTTIIQQKQTVALNDGGTYTEVDVACDYWMTAGDYVEVLPFQDSGGNLNINSVSEYTPVFSVVRI